MQGSLLAYLLRRRWAVRLLMIAIALIAACFGLLGPFFQKLFVDQLMGVPSVGTLPLLQEALLSLEGLPPLIYLFGAFFSAIAAQGFGLLTNYIGLREGVILQSEISEAVYQKTLALRSDAMEGSTVGEVVALYATDVPGATAVVFDALPMGIGIVFPLIFAPLAIWALIGVPILATVVVMISIVLLFFFLSRRQARFFFFYKQLAAERTGLVNEWIQNIRLLRILNWIEEYEAKIFRKRREETKNRVGMVTNGQLMGAFGSSINFFINLSGVAVLIYFKGSQVSPGELFALLWIFGVFLSRPFRQTPWIFTVFFDSLTSIKRIERFLALPSDPLLNRRSQTCDYDSAIRSSSESLALEVQNLSLKAKDQWLLEDVSFSVREGELVAIVGEVGSGKTLLLQSLVAETKAHFDVFRVGGQDALELNLQDRRELFSFVPQEGFIMSASLRENIVFRYDAESDKDPGVERSLELAQFPVESELPLEGLNTEIGERGVNLSGGQKQRVSLARAHFLDRPIVLLDDCLSAVDVDTEKQLINDLLDGAWKSRTRILVTHRLSVLKKVDRILFMEGGRIVESGTLDQLLAQSGRMREFVSSLNEPMTLEAQEQGRIYEKEIIVS